MRVTEKMTADNAIYNINKGQNRLNQLNEQLSSEVNINRPSDDPIATRQILGLQAQVNSIDQYISNIKNGQTWTNVANTALQGMNDLLTQAKSAASNILAGTNDSVSVSNALATLGNVRQQIIDLANVQVGDQYVFGGFNNSTPVYTNKSLKGTVNVTRTPNQITGLADTSALSVGMTVTGQGILPNTKITSIVNGSTITISTNPQTTGTGSYVFGGGTSTAQIGTTSPGNQLSGLTDTSGLSVGMTVSGTGIPANTTITAINNATTVTLSNGATVSGPGSFVFGGGSVVRDGATTTGANGNLTLPTTAGLAVGMTVTGSNIPANTTITAISSNGTDITLSNVPTAAGQGNFVFGASIIKPSVATVSGSNQIRFPDTTGLAVGMTVSGPGIPSTPAPTTITAIDTTAVPPTVTLSASATVSAASPPGVNLVFGQNNIQNGISSPGNRLGGLGTTTGLAIGMTVTGPGVPANTTIGSIVDANTITLTDLAGNPVTPTVMGTGSYVFGPVNKQAGSTTLTNQITGLNTSGLSVGMTVTGSNIPPNTTITAITNGSTVTLSNNPTAAAAGTFAFGPNYTQGGTTSLPNQLTGLADTSGLSVGMVVTGPGIPSGTTVTAIPNGTTVTLSRTPTITGTGSYTFAGVTTSQSGATDPVATPNQITGLSDTSSLHVGMAVSDPGNTMIPAGTTIAAIIDANTITLQDLSGNPVNPLVAGTGNFTFGPTSTQAGAIDPTNYVPPNQIKGLADTSGLRVGMTITGPNIPANTTITAISGTDVTISNIPTAAAGPVNFVFGQNNIQTGANQPNQISGLTNTAGLSVGMLVAGPGIPPNTTITGIDSNGTAVTLSNNATIGGAGTFSFSPAITQSGTTNPPNQITGLSPDAVKNLYVGMRVTGQGIPSDTTITAIDTSDPANPVVTLSKIPTSGGTNDYVFEGYLGAYRSRDMMGNTNDGSSTITGLSSTADLKVGMTVSGAGIPAGPPATTITKIINGTDIVISAPASARATPTKLTFSGYYDSEDVNVNINKSSQVALNYSGSKLLLGGAPAAASQSSAPPSTLPVNILGTIGELMAAIQNKDDAGIIAAASNLKTATDQVNLAQTEYASRATRLDSAETMLTNNQTTLKDIISSKQSLDTAKTIVLLQQQTTAYQAALQGTAKIMPLSLLDYLK